MPPNIAPHDTAGIGAWVIDDFARAARPGVAPNGAPHYPAFPYAFYGHLSDQDIADLWAAFQGVWPQDATDSDNDIAFPFNLRFGLMLWPAAYVKGLATDVDPDRSEAWNRGRRLVTGWRTAGLATRTATIWAVAKRIDTSPEVTTCPVKAKRQRSVQATCARPAGPRPRWPSG